MSRSITVELDQEGYRKYEKLCREEGVTVAESLNCLMRACADPAKKDTMLELLRLVARDSDRVYTIEELKTLLQPVTERYGICKLLVLGDYAMGTATPQSCVELYVETELTGLARVGLWDVLQTALKKEVLLNGVHTQTPIGEQKSVVLFECGNTINDIGSDKR